MQELIIHLLDTKKDFTCMEEEMKYKYSKIFMNIQYYKTLGDKYFITKIRIAMKLIE